MTSSCVFHYRLSFGIVGVVAIRTGRLATARWPVAPPTHAASGPTNCLLSHVLTQQPILQNHLLDERGTKQSAPLW